MISEWIDIYTQTHPWAYWTLVIFDTVIVVSFAIAWFGEFIDSSNQGKSLIDSAVNQYSVIAILFLFVLFLVYYVKIIITWTSNKFWDFVVMIF